MLTYVSSLVDLLVDTGSSNTWVSAQRPTKAYDPSKSNTSTDLHQAVVGIMLQVQSMLLLTLTNLSLTPERHLWIRILRRYALHIPPLYFLRCLLTSAIA